MASARKYLHDIKFKMNYPRGLLMVSYLDYPYHAGLSRRISGLARVLTTNGIKVKILAPIARSNVVFNDDTSRNLDVARAILGKTTRCE